MRVLFLCSGNSKFGISPIVKNQSESLRNSGVNIDYFTIKGKGLKGYLKNIPKLRKFLKSDKYNLIHAHYSYAGWVSILTIIEIPVVVSCMGSDIYGDVNYEGKRNFSSYFNILSAKLLQPFVNKIIVKSRNLERYIYIKDKVNIIPNGVDFKKFEILNRKKCREKLNINPKKKILLFLANTLEPRKNFKLLKKACSLIKNEELEISKPYPIPHSDIVFYLNAADVLVMTSYLEGSPNVIKEAMACNLPIVSTDVGDVKDVIGNTKGCYITSFDPKEVAKKIQMALDFGKRTNGRERIIKLGLDSDTIAKKIINIYQEVLNNR